jgi:Icc-related predicted phosphoesterase
MQKLFITISLIVFAVFIANGQDRPVLKFNAQSRFKIVQFTDTHIQYDSYRSDSVLVLMKTVIEREKPNLVVVTGDVVGSDNRKKAWLKLAQVMIDAKVPWAAMLGNHDAEYEIDKEETMKTIVGLPYNLTISGPKEIAGKGNYVLEIQSSKSQKTAALCYVLDSEEKPLPYVYEFMDESQVQWYKKQSAEYTRQNGGTPLPALAFFHIPFPEFKQVVDKPTTVGMNLESMSSAGSKTSNLFDAMQERKDVMGVFVGHEHNNNYIGVLNDICLGFGQITGRQVYGDLGAGARVIELHEGKRQFDSWVLKLYDNSRELDIWKPTHSRERKFFVSYPGSFAEKKNSANKITMTSEAAGKISVRLTGTGSATIDWGDGSKKQHINLSENAAVNIEHTYTGKSPRTIAIDGANITGLDCKGNKLSALDVRNNASLITLDCSENQLRNLDVSKNSDLKVLWCNGNQLNNLDVSKNAMLTELYCYRNLLSNLNVTNNTRLVWLNCYQNRLSSLDLSKNVVLRRLDCYENRLKTLDFSNNAALMWIVCCDNQFTTQTLNASIASLPRSSVPAKIYVAGNPGEKDCDRTLGEGKNWTVSMRY